MKEGTIAIDTPKHNFKNFDEARKWAKENISGSYKNNNTGEDICISNTAIDKYMSASSVLKSVDKDIHLSTLAKLPYLIESSILKFTKRDRGNNRDIKEIRRFYGTIAYEKEKYSVKITIKAYPTGKNKAYSYEVLKKESPIITEELSGQFLQSGQWEQYSTSSPHSDFSDGKDISFFQETK